MNMPKTYTHHRLDIYDVDLYVTTTARGWANIRRLVPFGELDAYAAGQTHAGRNEPADRSPGFVSVGVYINGQHASDGERINTCAHEAAHAAEEILRRCATPAEGEPLAYLVGWITAWLWENSH